MNILLFIFLSLVTCQVKIDVKKLANECSRTILELDVKGVEAMAPSRSEAEKSLKQFGMAIKVSQITDETEKKKMWAAHPELKLMEGKLRSVGDLLKLPKSEKIKVLESSQELLESVVKFAMLDGSNERSPIKGKDIQGYLKIGGDEIVSTLSAGGRDASIFFKNARTGAPAAANKTKKKARKIKNGSLKEKKFKEDGREIRLVFSKVIPPSIDA